MAALDCIVKYGVGQTANDGAWNDLCVEVWKMSAPWTEVVDVLKNAESEYKERTGRQLPPAYRSAKSVLKSALEHGVEFVDGNGQALGKSAVEKAIREAKEAPSDFDKFTNQLQVLKNTYDKLDPVAQSTARGILRGTFTEF